MKGIAVAIAIGLVLYLLGQCVFSSQHATLIAIVACLVTLWSNEALPIGVVSLLPILLFPIFGILDTNTVSGNYANPIIFLFLGGFMLAIAMEKSGLHHYFAAKLLAFFPKTPRGILYALGITAALLSGVLTNTTVTLMLMPIALFLSQNVQLKIRFLLVIAYGASIGGILTPIGTAPNLILLGFLEQHQLSVLSFGQWILLMFPVVVVMMLVVPFILSWGVSDLCVEDEKMQGSSPEASTLDTIQKRLYTILAFLVVVLIANTFSKEIFEIHIDEKLVLLGFGLLMFVPKIGFLTWEDTKAFPYEIIFLFGAGFSIAAAFSSTGLAEAIAEKLSFISTLSFFWMIVIVALFVVFATEITSNTALTSIAIPIFYEFSKLLPQHEGIVLLMVATVSASYAFMLPIATPPNAIIMSSRIITIKQMAMAGLKLNLIAVVVLSLAAYFYWSTMFE